MINTDQSMVLRSLFVMIAGVLVATGHLNASNSDLFVNDASALGGTLMAIIGTIYLCEHQFQKVKQDLTTPKLSVSSETSPSVSSAPAESTTP